MSNVQSTPQRRPSNWPAPHFGQANGVPDPCYGVGCLQRASCQRYADVEFSDVPPIGRCKGLGMYIRVVVAEVA